MFKNIYEGKRVLVTGHTGFKGAWLTSWLLKLGANVAGVSDRIPTQPSMFVELKLASKIEHHLFDICDREKLAQLIDAFRPDFIFHLAAQAIVSVSYEDPIKTIHTNVLGTATLLDVLRQWNLNCCVVVITSDKCYENIEWVWGYKETDQLGGKDIYSGSKGAAEIIFHAYFHSFFKGNNSRIKLATGRAGNVIGGGDWAKDRIVVDCVQNWSEGRGVKIRSPKATRPWQHVLEPLSGYLTLAQALFDSNKCSGESFNFGPRAEQSHTVLELLSDLAKNWGFSDMQNAYEIVDNLPFHEAGLLKLNCDKALFYLGWEANLRYSEYVLLVSEWYRQFYKEHQDMYDITLQQINKYEKLAQERGRIWSR